MIHVQRYKGRTLDNICVDGIEVEGYLVIDRKVPVIWSRWFCDPNNKYDNARPYKVDPSTLEEVS